MFWTESWIEWVACKDCLLHWPEFDISIKRWACNLNPPSIKKWELLERPLTKGDEFCAFGVQRGTWKRFLEIIIDSQASN